MTRRELAVSAAAAVLAGTSRAQSQAQRSRYGVATTSFLTALRPNNALTFAEHMHRLGAAGVQAPLASVDDDYIGKLKAFCGERGMYLEVMAPLPKDSPDAFEARVLAAKKAGARCVRSACLSGRRYETFASRAEWDAFVAQSRRSVEAAVKVAERHKMPLALENHKDWTLPEMVALLKQYSSPYLGVCLDTGNNMALLDDPYELVEQLAPYAVSTHIKDMDVEEIPDGFLLSEVPFGQGLLDLGRMERTIRQARPETPFLIEMITRDPLRVPCLTDRYWETMGERPARPLARMLMLVRRRRAATPPPPALPRVSALSRADLLKKEEENVVACLRT